MSRFETLQALVEAAGNRLAELEDLRDKFLLQLLEACGINAVGIEDCEVWSENVDICYEYVGDYKYITIPLEIINSDDPFTAIVEWHKTLK